MMSGARRLPLRWIALGLFFVCAGTLIALLAYLSGDRRVVTETSDSKPPKLTEKPSPSKPPAKKSTAPSQQSRAEKPLLANPPARKSITTAERLHEDDRFLEDGDDKEQNAPGLTPMEVWKLVAKDEGLSQQLVADVHNRLGALLIEHRIFWTQGQVTAYSESLRKFLKLHKQRFNSYWLLFCTAEAFSRSDRMRNDNSALDDYDLLIDDIVDVLSVRITKSLPPGRAPAWSGIIRDTLTKHADETRQYISALRADFLCPSYHRPMIKSKQQKLIRRWLDHEDYPRFGKSERKRSKKYEEFRERMRKEFGDPIKTKEEIFRRRLIGRSKYFATWFVTRSFMDDALEMTRRTKYWGYMYYSAGNFTISVTGPPSGRWPAWVKLRSAGNKKTNAARPKAATEMVRTWLSGNKKTIKAVVRALIPANGRQVRKVKEQAIRLSAILSQVFNDEMRRRLVTYIGHLDSKDRETYEAGIEGFAKIDPVPVLVLTILMKSENTRVRLGAVKALKRIGPPAVSAIPALHDALQDRAYSVQRHAAYALGRIGPRSVPFLVKVLEQKKHPVVGYHVIEALGEVGPEAHEAVPILLWVMQKAKSNFLRAIAAEALGKVGSNTPEVLSALRGALKDDDSWVRGHAATALSNVGPVTAAEVAALIKALGDKVNLVRWRAASALGKLDPETPEIIAVLLGSLQDSDSDVRAIAAQALENTGGRDKKMLQALVKLLEDKDYFVRLSSAKALGNFGPAGKDAIPALQVLLHEIDSRVRNASSDALRKIAPGVKFEARRPPGAEDIF